MSLKLRGDFNENIAPLRGLSYNRNATEAVRRDSSSQSQQANLNFDCHNYGQKRSIGKP